VKMPKYLVLFKPNTAIQPTDPKVAQAQLETTFAALDALIKAGKIKDMGLVAPAEGYSIIEYPSAEEAFKDISPFFPMNLFDMREIISYENAKKIVLAQARILASKSK